LWFFFFFFGVSFFFFFFFFFFPFRFPLPFSTSSGWTLSDFSAGALFPYFSPFFVNLSFVSDALKVQGYPIFFYGVTFFLFTPFSP